VRAGPAGWATGVTARRRHFDKRVSLECRINRRQVSLESLAQVARGNSFVAFPTGSLRVCVASCPRCASNGHAGQADVQFRQTISATRQFSHGEGNRAHRLRGDVSGETREYVR
jgi:hypothetical protein